jgi:hypothetical protein
VRKIRNFIIIFVLVFVHGKILLKYPSGENYMTAAELLPILKALNHMEKIRAIQFLANEVVREESFFEEGKNYDIWSPFESSDAAEQLTKLIEEREKVNV